MPPGRACQPLTRVAPRPPQSLTIYSRTCLCPALTPPTPPGAVSCKQCCLSFPKPQSPAWGLPGRRRIRGTNVEPMHRVTEAMSCVPGIPVARASSSPRGLAQSWARSRCSVKPVCVLRFLRFLKFSASRRGLGWVGVWEGAEGKVWVRKAQAKEALGRPAVGAGSRGGGAPGSRGVAPGEGASGPGRGARSVTRSRAPGGRARRWAACVSL